MKGSTGEIIFEIHGKDRRDKPLPAYFLSLTVENVRCFGLKQTLDLANDEGQPAQWTIILGDNGVGKTTLLQSLVAITPLEELFFDKDGEPEIIVSPRCDNDLWLGQMWNPMRHGAENNSFMISASYYTRASLEKGRGGKRVDDFHFRGYGKASHPIASCLEQSELPAFPCFGYGASRRLGAGSLKDTAADNAITISFSESLFSEDVVLVNAEEWLLQADYVASKPSAIQQQAKKRRDQIKDILIKLLPDVEKIRFAQFSETQMKLGIEVQTPYGWVAMKDLSLGYKTLIAWMVDFASRLFDLYPDSPNPLAEPAVVLVDEIDLHLHPKWQRSLMGYLSELFPNTQFIATAHSPLVVQAAVDANIVVLRREGDHVIIDNDIEAIRGWRIDQILTSDLFGLESARPPQLDGLMAERKKILSKGRLTKRDRKKLQELEEKIGPLPAGETLEDSAAMDIIRRAAERLKQQ
jgi:predicted ATPase